MAPKKASSRVSNLDNRNTDDSDVPVESGHPPHQPEQIPLPHPPAPTLSPAATETVTRDQFNALVHQVQLLTAAFQASQAQHQAALQAGSMAASQPSPVGPSAAPQQQPHPVPIAARQPSPDRPVESQPLPPAPQQQQAPTASRRSQQPPVAPHLSGNVPDETRGRHARKRSPSPLSYGEESTPHSSPFRRAFSQHSQLAPDREAIVDQRFQEMSRRIEALQNKVSVPVSSARNEPPFSERIMREPIPANFKVPPIESYDGSTDPNDHVDDFQNQMLLRQTSDALLCRAFPSTLRGVAKHWFNALKPGSIDCFQDLVNSFAAHFVSSQKRRKGSDYLVTIKQREGESLRSYLNRFNAAILEVRQLDPSVAMTAMKSGLRNCPFLFSIKKTYPRSWPEMLARAEKYANAEDEDEPKESQAGDKPKMVPQSPPTEESTKETGRKSSREHRPHPPLKHRRDRSPDRRHVPITPHLTPLNSSREAILMEIGARLPEPRRMRTRIHHRRDPHLYCRYHRDHGHDTEQCVQLQDEIEKLIQRGALQHFVLGRNPPRPFRQPRPYPRDNRPPVPPQPAPQAPRQAPEPGEPSTAVATRVPRAEIHVIEAQNAGMPGMQAPKG